MTTANIQENRQSSVRNTKGGNSETRTRLRKRVQRNLAKEDGDRTNQSSQFGQASNLLQLKPLLPSALPVVNHTTLRPATTLGSSVTTPVQTKLQVNEPNDVYEVEAERVADQVMRMPAGDLNGWGRSAPTAPNLQLKCAACGSQDEMAMRSAQSTMPEVTPAIERNIQKMQGSGKPLDDTSRSFFEQRMGADFSNVRIHTDTNAIQTSRDINARAFTTGNNIAFNSGEYNPNTAAGKHLLAHELTHTIQQNHGINRIPNIQRIIPAHCVKPVSQGKTCKAPAVTRDDLGDTVAQDEKKKISHIHVNLAARKIELHWNGTPMNPDTKKIKNLGSIDPHECTPNPSKTPTGYNVIGEKHGSDHTSWKRYNMAWFTAFKSKPAYGFHNSQPLGSEFKSAGCVRLSSNLAEIINKNTSSNWTTIFVE
ncbi:MAG: eCIS core domain-containing protein [Candidatus Promineifilaceae bacterium]